MANINKLFLSARVNKTATEVEVTVETYICLFVYVYSDFKLKVCFVDDVDNYTCSVPFKVIENINYECIIDKSQLISQGIDLFLPAVQEEGGRSFTAGICAVLRWVLKYNAAAFPNHYANTLLGFRGGCLVACAESSIWTKFCELQLPSSVTEIASLKKFGQKLLKIPENLVLLEAHLNRPVRTHNILKRKLDLAKKIKQQESNTEFEKTNDGNGITTATSEINFTMYDNNSLPMKQDDISKALENLVITEKSQEFSLDHNYLEGIDLTLADMIVFPCVYFLLENLPPSSAVHLEKVMKWYKRMCKNNQVQIAAEVCGFHLNKIGMDFVSQEGGENIVVPLVDKDSLYKRDPSHTKMKCKHRNPSNILTLLQDHSIRPHFSTNYCTKLDWDKLPSSLHPATGDLPQKRIDRKCQQIESIVTATLKVAVDGQTIVEFCAGGGHVGLLLAYYLPNCKVILIENKESSILRAKSRAEALKLDNISFYQCNLDYFKGSFDLGLSLHACGVATDLVIQQCLKQKASFVCCPCCYGSIQNTHLLSYPLSKKFRDTTITYKMYTFLAHCADRTEVNTPTAQQGELCMGLIDTDRVFFAQEYGYEVDLTTLHPTSCSPKHNLLIGRSPKWKKNISN